MPPENAKVISMFSKLILCVACDLWVYKKVGQKIFWVFVKAQALEQILEIISIFLTFCSFIQNRSISRHRAYYASRKCQSDLNVFKINVMCSP